MKNIDELKTNISYNIKNLSLFFLCVFIIFLIVGFCIKSMTIIHFMIRALGLFVIIFLVAALINKISQKK